jgi:hypothetical protein
MLPLSVLFSELCHRTISQTGRLQPLEQKESISKIPDSPVHYQQMLYRESVKSSQRFLSGLHAARDKKIPLQGLEGGICNKEDERTVHRVSQCCLIRSQIRVDAGSPPERGNALTVPTPEQCKKIIFLFTDNDVRSFSRPILLFGKDFGPCPGDRDR